MTQKTTGILRGGIFWVFALTVVILISPYSASVAEARDINIRFSPNVLNIASEGEVVTIHTDEPYSNVVGASVVVVPDSGDPVNISWWKADDRGNFVAKFVMEEIKDIPGLSDNETYHFVVRATTTTDEVLVGIADVRVIDRSTKF